MTPMMQKKLDVHLMFKTAEEFFVSLGWPKLSKIFWKKSIFVDPKDRPVSCHPSAWDFSLYTNGEMDIR